MSDGVATPSQRLMEFDLAEAARERTLRPGRRPLRLLLFRHGESAMNVQPDIVSGRSNSAPLTEKGRAQATALGARLKSLAVEFDQIFSSTAVRARDTALIACGSIGVDCQQLTESPELLEICQGSWTGRNRADVYDAAFLEQVELEQCFFRPPGVSHQDAPPSGEAPRGESQWDVECRIAAFVDNLLEAAGDGSQSAKDVRTVGIFMHGVAIRCLLRRILGASATSALHCDCQNTSITELVYDTSPHNLAGWQVVRTNDAAHLERMCTPE
mmetsp:Transcript_63587/g.168451  ORF Transcript_63587/g.168451 Transcript_63587/m.168451 type:complete len:271 (-) Transcript_63587:90-902(-)